MPRPDSIVTENDFPLDDHREDALVDQPFPVLVMWHDLSESPSQCIQRLNSEVIEMRSAHAPIQDLLLSHATDGTKSAMLAAARAFCADTEANADSEYVRGQAELICDTLGISTDRKDDVAAWLCA